MFLKIFIMKKNSLYISGAIASTLLSSNILASVSIIGHSPSTNAYTVNTAITARTPSNNSGTNLFMSAAGVALAPNERIDQHLRLKLVMDNINTDDIYIGFDKKASTRYVANEDAPYMPGYGKVSLASISS